MREHLTQPIEDYLKTIYLLTREQPTAGTNQIAEALGITAASVTGMLKKLSETEPPLITYHKHRGASLTTPGEQVALEILRHHRLLETFLYQMLGYSWDEVHVEADRLEHFISEKFEERISKALGNPSHDPHGDPIPDRQLLMPDSAAIPLADARPPQTLTIQRVYSADPELLRYLFGLGLTPHAHLKILEHSSFDGNITLQVDGQTGPTVLGPAITNRIFVLVE
jgi:DtxR family Mn-dependent transcriptional regulator